MFYRFIIIFPTSNRQNRIILIKKIKINKKGADDNVKFHKKIFNVSNKYQSASDSERYKYQLLKAKDESKDQSYFLYRLKQNELSKSIFPIGDYTKKQVREIAKKAGFPNFDRKSTVGICFIGKVNLKKFLQKKISPKPGIILNPKGNKIRIIG